MLRDEAEHNRANSYLSFWEKNENFQCCYLSQRNRICPHFLIFWTYYHLKIAKLLSHYWTFFLAAIFLANALTVVVKSLIYMGQFPQDGENGQKLAFFLELWCDQTIWFFKLFSTVLKRFWPGHSKNVFVLVLAHLEPEQELFEVWVLYKLGSKQKHFSKSLQDSWEKFKKSNCLVRAELQKKKKKCHILTIFPVLGKSTHICK